MTSVDTQFKKGHRLSPESLEKMRKSKIGKPSLNKGRKMSDEARKKMSLSRMGKSPWNKGKLMTEETKKKVSIARKGHVNSMESIIKRAEKMRGEKHWNWKGGITHTNHILRNRIEVKLWRESVFKRDNYTCIWCHEKGGKLNADHIKPWALFPELRLAIDNGRTLCVKCHRTTDTYGNRKIYKNNYIK